MRTGAVKSASRTMQILSHFCAVRVPQSQKNLCEALGYPQSSATGLLKTLTGMGYLNYDRAHRVYFPTVKLAGLGEWIPTALFGQGRLLQLVREVHAATNETVAAVIRNDINIQYIAVLHSSHAERFPTESGEMRPVTQSAVGWLFMSALSDDDTDHLVRRSNIATGRAAAARIPAILTHVRDTRLHGYCYAEDMPFTGGATLGILLPLTMQGQPIALCVGGTLKRMRENRARYHALLVEFSRGLERGATASSRQV